MGARAWRRRNGGLSLVQCPSIVHGQSVTGLARRARASEAHALGLVPKESERSGAQARYMRKPPRAVKGRAGTWEHGPGADETAAFRSCSALPKYMDRVPPAWRGARVSEAHVLASPHEVACACSALARYCARSLWGRGPACVLPTRVRVAPSWRHSVHVLWNGTARASGRRSIGTRSVLPRALEAPAHAHVAAEGTRDVRALAIARAVAWTSGVGPTACLPSAGLPTNAIYQRMVPAARSVGSVRSRSGGAPLEPPAHALVANQILTSRKRLEASPGT